MGDMNEDKVFQKLGEHDKQFDLLATILNKHEERLSRLEDKIDDFYRRFLTAHDEIMTILRKLDEERVFTTRWIERIEEEITKIKAHLNIK
ncbi:hypothetical protein A2116_01290 [Candidatus Jorgensenbacteria bacterium GWA1_49_17]|uniref:Uncharacterized protein n=1 Tax=Candidatus Jorgensenbacteria bacterium GWA1_49_17 TaxID=1798467 RepID=A0A1F6BVA6_9BACT|nr:MAG: hypothetical protein UV62_C0029G0011 [Parcubacteria group bacterium GW2011_GWC1_43_11]OGG40702.1 MAG: hypothetical protein A2116_01290 [Candidatus Jorgensenbacteria bacterium GWA1_49_17]